MASKLENDDCLLVGRDGVDYRVSYQDLAAQMKVDIGKSLLKEVQLQMEREKLAMKHELEGIKTELAEELRRNND